MNHAFRWKALSSALVSGILLLLAASCALPEAPAGQSPAASRAVGTSAYKIVGYMPDWQGDVTAVQYDKLTHVDYAFLQANANGSLDLSGVTIAKLQQLTTLAHAKGTKVLISLGGWSNNAALTSAMNNAAARSALATNCLNFVSQYGLDGLDFDWEGPANATEGAEYASFVQTLAATLRPLGKLTTSAVASWFGDNIPASSFASLDFVNLMAYDNDGLQHSDYNFAVAYLDTWAAKGVPASKMILGVPFYGYADAAHSNEVGYNTLVAKDPNAANLDYSQGVYYNGIPTIQKKTNLVVSRGAGGIMIWELAEDAPGSASLLSAIYAILFGGTPPVTYAVTASAGAHGTVSPSGTVQVAKGASQSFTFAPAAGYSVDTLTIDGAPVAAAPSYTFANVAAAHTLAVSFKTGGVPAHPTYAPNTVYNNGDIVTWKGHDWKAGWWTQNQEPGTTGQWGVWTDLGPSGPAVVYTLTATAGANGSISPAGTVTVADGASQGYTITPAAGYAVADVVVNGASVGAVTSYTVTNVKANGTIGATFKLDATPTFAITATAGANGTITPAGSTSVKQGASQAYTITAAAGFAVADVSVDGKSVGAVTSYSFTNVTAAHTIAASFIVSSTPAWAVNTAYKLGDKVTYQGVTYVCKYAHTSNSAWVPGTPGLWFWEKA